MDRLPDKGAAGPLHLKRPDVAALVVEALVDSEVRFKRCRLYAFVVMPNHVHLLATQFVPLARWLGPLKGFTANQAKRALRLRDGACCQNESYDHLVRSDEEFRRIQRYIEWNPVKAGFVQKPEQFRWSSADAAWKGG